MNHTTEGYSNAKISTLFQLSHNILIFLGLACFSASFFLPVFFTSAENIYGYWVLITGWMGLVFFQFAWFANPLNLLALLIYREKPKVAILISLLALTIASDSFSFNEIPTGINYEKIFIKEFGIGLYLWFVAHTFILLSLLVRFLESFQSR